MADRCSLEWRNQGNKWIEDSRNLLLFGMYHAGSRYLAHSYRILMLLAVKSEVFVASGSSIRWHTIQKFDDLLIVGHESVTDECKPYDVAARPFSLEKSQPVKFRVAIIESCASKLGRR